MDSCLTFDPEAQHVPETTTRLTNDCGSMTLVSGQRAHRHTYGTADMTYVVNTGDWSTLRVCHWQAQQRSAMVNITYVPDAKINFAMVGVSRLGRTARSIVSGRWPRRAAWRHKFSDCAPIRVCRNPRPFPQNVTAEGCDESASSWRSWKPGIRGGCVGAGWT